MKQIKLFVLILLLPAGCERDVNPSELILGKWQVVERWYEHLHYHERTTNGQIVEFLPDGTCVFSSEFKQNYRIDSEFLYFDNSTYPDGGDAYRYTFSGSHKHRFLRMDYVADETIWPIWTTATSLIYRQLK
jgi:hypothetical protein